MEALAGRGVPAGSSLDPCIPKTMSRVNTNFKNQIQIEQCQENVIAVKMLPLAPDLEGSSGQGQVALKGVQLLAGRLDAHHACMDRCNLLQGKRQICEMS